MRSNKVRSAGGSLAIVWANFVIETVGSAKTNGPPEVRLLCEIPEPCSKAQHSWLR